MEAERPRRVGRPLAFVAFTLLMTVLAVGFVALGVWQVQRLGWKNDLVAAVAERTHAAPVDLAGLDWSALNETDDAYRRVSARGMLGAPVAYTQAVTDHGGGFWVMSPLRLADGRSVLVNRGFVTREGRDAMEAEGPAPEEVTVTGLLRATEPEGGFLRSNDPAAGRWHSRDVAEIASAAGIADVAPMFVDADPVPGATPIGGLTVLTFSNNHLVYALTWFTLAGLSIFGWVLVLRERRKRAGDEGERLARPSSQGSP
ncbi:SURF1 family protein [Aureimonas mangrovi]|uniref:SURF1 family protein n=1 Tax=Aureimonas mangrovi TaxID=2758041 RepID=UPI00163DAA86|nr:SURF1 family protein [Aureimonas mangrovi]